MRGWRLLPVVALLCAVTACGPGYRVVPTSFSLEAAPRPEDREVRIQFTIDPFVSDPVDHIEVQRQGDHIGIRVWIRQDTGGGTRSAIGGMSNTTVHLDEPVGQAIVVDLSAQPPRTVPPGPR
ncbi:hypothetical protein [Kibdelosporangium aridum]|uniref:hypothetical protein n=1 Tax=Kibdelosporangium aridum TaxID=2030 RepID=UPI0035E7AE94